MCNFPQGQENCNRSTIGCHLSVKEWRLHSLKRNALMSMQPPLIPKRLFLRKEDFLCNISLARLLSLFSSSFFFTTFLYFSLIPLSLSSPSLFSSLLSLPFPRSLLPLSLSHSYATPRSPFDLFHSFLFLLSQKPAFAGVRTRREFTSRKNETFLLQR